MPRVPKGPDWWTVSYDGQQPYYLTPGTVSPIRIHYTASGIVMGPGVPENPLVPVEPSYHETRAKFLESGLIADKEAMLECVTLAVPYNWDTWGSVLKEPPAPERRRVPLFVPVTLLVTLVMIVIAVGALVAA